MKRIGIGITLFVGLVIVSGLGYSVWDKWRATSCEPSLVQSAPKYNIGDVVRLSIKHTCNNDFKVTWKVFDGLDEKSDGQQTGPNDFSFGTGPKPKTFLVVAAVSYDVGGKLTNYLLVARIKVGEGPNPPPIPPDPIPPTPVFPDEVFKLSSFVYSEFSKLSLQEDLRAKVAKGFAQNIDSIVAAINAKTLTNSEKALKDLTIANNKTLSETGVGRQDVLPYFLALERKLVEVDNQQNLANLEKLKQALKEMSTGLKAIR